MDSYLSGDSRNIRIPNVSSWVIWVAVKKSGSEILIKEEKWQHIDPYISIFWALPINHYFYSLYALWGFLILSHTTKISPSEKGCWAIDRNSMWGIVQLLNSKIETILEKDGRRIWGGGGLLYLFTFIHLCYIDIAKVSLWCHSDIGRNFWRYVDIKTPPDGKRGGGVLNSEYYFRSTFP